MTINVMEMKRMEIIKTIQKKIKENEEEEAMENKKKRKTRMRLSTDEKHMVHHLEMAIMEMNMKSLSKKNLSGGASTDIDEEMGSQSAVDNEGGNVSNQMNGSDEAEIIYEE